MKISIITVTLNAERFLRETIRSVAGQDYPGYEHVIVDGGSRDKTIEIIRDAAERDTRISYRSEPDGGISDAMNKGAQEAAGEILGFLHGDDFFATETSLRSVVECFERNPHDIWLTGGIRYVDERSRPLKDLPVRRYSYRRLIRGNIILHPATFVKKDSFVNLGAFSTDLSYAMDYDLWLRLGKVKDPLVVRDILTCFRVHGGSLSCRHSDEAFVEEWKVRRRAVGEGPCRLFHHCYYLLKRAIHGRYFKTQIL